MLRQQSFITSCCNGDRFTTLMRRASVHGLHIDTHGATHFLIRQCGRDVTSGVWRHRAVAGEECTLDGDVLDESRGGRRSTCSRCDVVWWRATRRIYAMMKRAAGGCRRRRRRQRSGYSATWRSRCYTGHCTSTLPRLFVRLRLWFAKPRISTSGSSALMVPWAVCRVNRLHSGHLRQLRSNIVWHFTLPDKWRVVND